MRVVSAPTGHLGHRINHCNLFYTRCMDTCSATKLWPSKTTVTIYRHLDRQWTWLLNTQILWWRPKDQAGLLFCITLWIFYNIMEILVWISVFQCTPNEPQGIYFEDMCILFLAEVNWITWNVWYFINVHWMSWILFWECRGLQMSRFEHNFAIHYDIKVTAKCLRQTFH